MEKKDDNPQPNLVVDLLKLDREIHKLDKTLKKLKQDRIELESRVKQQFVDTGTQSVRLASGESAYMRRQIYASKHPDVDAGLFARQMKAAGLSEFVHETINPQQLSAWVRELEMQHEGDITITDDWDPILPEQLKGLVKVHEKVGISILGAKSRS
jgi:hypothetical protein